MEERRTQQAVSTKASRSGGDLIREYHRHRRGLQCGHDLSAKETWKALSRSSLESLALQCGHDFSAMESLDNTFAEHRKEVLLQCGHDFSAMESWLASKFWQAMGQIASMWP